MNPNDFPFRKPAWCLPRWKDSVTFMIKSTAFCIKKKEIKKHGHQFASYSVNYNILLSCVVEIFVQGALAIQLIMWQSGWEILRVNILGPSWWWLFPTIRWSYFELQSAKPKSKWAFYRLKAFVNYKSTHPTTKSPKIQAESIKSYKLFMLRSLNAFSNDYILDFNVFPSISFHSIQARITL